MSIIYLTNDLMFSSRVSGAVRAAGAEMNVVGDVAAAVELLQAGSVRLVFLDLSLPGLDPSAVVQKIRDLAPDVAVIAYGPHVHEQKLAAAKACGCDKVLSKGQFNSTVNELIVRYTT